MSNDTELLRQMFLDNLSETTGTVLMKWADEIRTQEVEKMRAILQTQKYHQEHQYDDYRYAISSTRMSQDNNGVSHRMVVNEYRLTEDGLKHFADSHNMEYSKLFEVATGKREVYTNFIQGEFTSRTFGKKFVKPNNDKFPGEDKPIREKVGAGMFRLVKRQDNDD